MTSDSHLKTDKCSNDPKMSNNSHDDQTRIERQRLSIKQKQQLRSVSTIDPKSNWWKVCWFYDNRNVCLNNIISQRYASLPRLNARVISDDTRNREEKVIDSSSKATMKSSTKSNSSFAMNHFGCDLTREQKHRTPLSQTKWPLESHHSLKNISSNGFLNNEDIECDVINDSRSNNRIDREINQINMNRFSHLDLQQNLLKLENINSKRPTSATSGLDDKTAMMMMNKPIHLKESKSTTKLTSSETSDSNSERSKQSEKHRNGEQQSRHLFTLPRIFDPINRNETIITKFNDSQQLFSNRLLVNKITQPLQQSWSSLLANKIESQRNRIVNFLNQYKGLDWREKQLSYQMPSQDEQSFQKFHSESKFIRNKRRKASIRSELFALNQQNQTEQAEQFCQKCDKNFINEIHCVKSTLPINSSSVKENHKLLNRSTNHQCLLFHIDCFTCCQCDEIIVDLKAYLNPIDNSHKSPNKKSLHNNESIPLKFYCSRHFVELFKPRCPQCDKLIFDEECTEAEGKAWHIGHFCCHECKRSLGGQQYIMAKDNRSNEESKVNANCEERSLPYCLTCFDILFGELCEECGELIGCEVGAIVHEGRSWHANEKCFRCSLCLKNLLGKPFLPALDGRIYCSIVCSQAMIEHRKKRLKKKNKLQRLHSSETGNEEKILEQTKLSSMYNFQNGNVASNNKINIEKNDQNLNHSERSDHREKRNDLLTLKSLKLNSRNDYEAFIKRSNQYFTTKYDWSKEKEFESAPIESITESSINSDACSLTASTTSERIFEENTLQNCEEFKMTSEQVLRNTIDHLATSDDQWIRAMDQYQKNPSELYGIIKNLSISQSIYDNHSDNTVHYQNASILHHLDANKINLMNSPTISSEQTVSAISPPPEYSNIDLMRNEENSSNNSSLIQTIQRSKIGKETSMNNDSADQSDSNSSSKYSKLNEINTDLSNQINQAKFIAAVNMKIKDHQNNHDQYHQIDSNLDNSNRSIEFNKLHRNSTKSSKSVSFDPSIKDIQQETSRKLTRSNRFRNCNDDEYSSDSCSTCSTCSSSSDDEDDEFDQYEDFCSFRDQSVKTNNNPMTNNDACRIS
ncbi:Protein prickle [Sarcoptes scabiei]|uniref:Protein prickle n=1 Tax=Sarcoptes scabiei TaxID=52283 RepID=A0A834VD04_SARSC|nr:Protein prickle [Sarcoptes scabiei]